MPFIIFETGLLNLCLNLCVNLCVNLCESMGEFNGLGDSKGKKSSTFTTS